MKKIDTEIVLLKRALADAQDAVRREFMRAENNAAKARNYDLLVDDLSSAQRQTRDADNALREHIAAHAAELARAQHTEKVVECMWKDAYVRCTCGGVLGLNLGPID